MRYRERDTMFADTMVLKVTQQEELLKLILLDHLQLVYFFDVTPNSNSVVSSLNAIRFVSKRGHTLKTFDNKVNFDTTFHSGVVVNWHKMDVIGLSDKKKSH